MAKSSFSNASESYRYQLLQHQVVANRQFWVRFGGRPDVTGMRVLDFGCSEGGLLADMLECGAAYGAGIDLSTERIAKGNEILKPLYRERFDLHLADVRTLDLPSDFDVIVSRNTLEHVSDLDNSLAALLKLARPGARIYFGFSPLWYSPFGHHGYPKTRVPWMHVLGGDKVVLDAYNAEGNQLDRVLDEFNKLGPKDFRAAFSRLPVRDLVVRTNVAEGALKSLAMGFARTLAHIPFLEKYLTVGIYASMIKV